MMTRTDTDKHGLTRTDTDQHGPTRTYTDLHGLVWALVVLVCLGVVGCGPEPEPGAQVEPDTFVVGSGGEELTFSFEGRVQIDRGSVTNIYGPRKGVVMSYVTSTLLSGNILYQFKKMGKSFKPMFQ